MNQKIKGNHLSAAQRKTVLGPQKQSKKYTYIHRTRFFRKDSLMIIRMRSPTVYHLPAGGGPGKPVVSFQSKSKGLRTRELMG